MSHTSPAETSPHILEREDVARMVNAIFDDFLFAPPHDDITRIIRMTSGTTGREPMMVLRELQDGSANQVAWFTDVERPLVCFSQLQLRSIYVSYFRVDRTKQGSPILAIDSADLTDDIAPLLADLAPDQLMGFPHMALRLADYFSESAVSTVRALRMTGEPLDESLHAMLAKRFPAATIRSQYIMAEIASISAMTCAYLPVRRFHPADHVRIEIFEPDETGAGDLLVSTVIHQRVPVSRYRVGDVARLVDGVCRCGEKTTFELLGRRGYDFVKIAGALLVRDDFDRVAGLCADLFDDYRAEVREVERHGTLCGNISLRIYRDDGRHPAGLEDEVAARYSRELFLSGTQTLDEFVTKGLFMPIAVSVVTEPFPSKHKNVKLSFRSEYP